MSTETEATTPRWDSMRAMLAPGNLLVARQGSAIVVARADTPDEEALFDSLSTMCAEFPADEPGENLIRQIAGLATTGARVPTFGVVTTGTSGTLIMISGGLRAVATLADGATHELDGSDSLLPLTHVVKSGLARLVVAPDPEELEPDRRSNLSGGVVRAGGLVLVLGASGSPAGQDAQTMVDLRPAGTIEPMEDESASPTDTATPSFTSFSLTEDDVTEEGRQESLEPVDASAESGVEPPAPPLVPGIVCSRGHFNAPTARFCSHCGISMVHQTHNIVTGARPPLGVLVTDDGARFPLVQDFVIGRDAASSDDALAARAAPLVLDDVNLSLSRVHARLLLDGWEVRIEDAGSANGTFIAAEGSDEWRRLEAGRPTTITPGTRVQMGSRVLTFESHHRT